MKKYISYIYVILSAVCWGFIGFSNRLLTAAGIELGNRVFIRNFGTLLVLTVVFGLFHRQVFRIQWKHLPIFLCSGLISILTLSLVYFQCQTMCSLSVAAVLLYTSPVFVMIMSAFLFKGDVPQGHTRLPADGLRQFGDPAHQFLIGHAFPPFQQIRVDRSPLLILCYPNLRPYYSITFL